MHVKVFQYVRNVNLKIATYDNATQRQGCQMKTGIYFQREGNVPSNAK